MQEITTWQDRMTASGKRESQSLAVECMEAEIAELRSLQGELKDAVMLLTAERDQEKAKRQYAERLVLNYATAARVISLHLADFMPKPGETDEIRTLDEEIAEAARRAGAEIKRLNGLADH